MNILQRSKEKTYKFDRIFDKDEMTETLFESVVKKEINHTASGYNSCVFAFGATGSGKTYTMFGKGNAKKNQEYSPGIIECSARVALKHLPEVSLRSYRVRPSSRTPHYRFMFRDLQRNHL